MKKAVIYAIITFIVILLIWFIAKLITKKVDKDTNNFHEPFRKQNIELFLGNIDFSNGSYAIYVRHKELGEFAVTNEEGLKANRHLLKVKLSWANYLPYKGDRGFGVMLFKDNKLVKKKTGGVFNIFEIGTLKNYAIGVKNKSFMVLSRTYRKNGIFLRKEKQF